MEKLSFVWKELQKKNRQPSSALTAACRAELDELIHQLDIMYSNKTQEWESQYQHLKTQLKSRDSELREQRTTISLKNKEIDELQTKLDAQSKTQTKLVDEYEDQLVRFRAEIQKMKKDYDRLQKRQVRQTKEGGRHRKEKEELHDSSVEMQKLNEKLEEYQQRSKEWELQKKALKKQVEALDAQRRALSEKCEFVQADTELGAVVTDQQQAATYQMQLDRRREIQDQTELSLKNQISAIESQVSRSNDTITLQKDKIDTLKKSLNDAMEAHKRSMTDNERLIDDLKKAHQNIRQLESDRAAIELELQKKTDLLRMTEEDKEEYCASVARLEQTLSAKDDVIRSFTDSAQQEEAEQIRMLRSSLAEAKDESRHAKKKESQLRKSVEALEGKLKSVSHQHHDTSSRLHEKEEELDRIKNSDLKALQDEVMKLQSKLAVVEQSHAASVEGMKQRITELSEELHQRNVAMARLSERSASTEKRMREDTDSMEKKTAELKVASAQIEALRSENRLLRQDLMEHIDTIQASGCGQSAMARASEVSRRAAVLEQENRQLKMDIGQLKREMEELRQMYEERLAATSRSAEISLQDLQSRDKEKLHKAELNADQRFHSMQNYLESTVRRYDDQLALLQTQRARLEEQLKMERMEKQRLEREVQQSLGRRQRRNSAHSGDTLLESEAMSLATTLDSPRSDEGILFHDSVSAAAEQFLSEEQERARELERLLDSHIDSLTEACAPLARNRSPGRGMEPPP